MDSTCRSSASSGDGGYYLASVKGVVENGWFWHNPDLGAPFGQSNYDFPAPFGDIARLVIVRILGVLLGGDPVLVFNAFFLLCFPLIAVVAYGVLRDLGAAQPAALVAGVLFAFLPYHLARNQTHLFLTSYYAIPIAVWLVIAVAEGRRLLDPDRAARRRTLLVAGLCLLVGAASNYYAVTALLTARHASCRSPRSRAARRPIAVQGAAVTALVAASFALCHSPAIVYPLDPRRERRRRRAPAQRERDVRPEARLHGHPAARAPRRLLGAARQGLPRRHAAAGRGLRPVARHRCDARLRRRAARRCSPRGLAGRGRSRCGASRVGERRRGRAGEPS